MDAASIEVFERSARCLLLFQYLLAERVEFQKIHRKQNIEQLNETLNCCMALYGNARSQSNNFE